MSHKIIIFDDTLKTRSGKCIPYYHEQRWGSDDDSECIDQSLHWFHEGYGLFQLYRLHQCKDSNAYWDYYIAEPLKKFVRTGDTDWNEKMDHPEKLLTM